MIALLAMVFAAQAQYREVKLPSAPKQTSYKDYSTEESGFWCAAELEGASSVMVHKKNMQFVNVAFIGGYRFSEFLRVGAGTGLRCYVNNADVRDTDSRFGLPIFVNARGNFIPAYDRDAVPFWSVNIGGITGEGFFASPTLGYSFGGLRNTLQVGISYTITSFKNSLKDNQLYSYFGLKIGYEF